MTFLKQNIPFNKSVFILILLLIAAPFILYFPSLKYDFIHSLDDGWLIETNNTIRQFSLYGLKHHFLNDSVEPMHYHPFFFISLSIDYYFFGLNPFGYKLHNLLLHIITGILLFTFIYLLVKNKWTAFIVALLFLIHPVNIESITWAVCRRFPLFFSYFLASMIAYKLYLEELLKKNNFLLFVFAIIFWIISLLAKETAIVLPAIFVLMYLAEKKEKFKIKTIAKHIVVMIPIMLFFWHMASGANDTNFLKRSFNYSNFTHVIFAGYSYSFYWLKGIFPFPLSVFYPAPTEYLPIAAKYYLMFISSFVLVVLMIYHFFKKQYLLFFSLAYYTVTILPVVDLMFYPLGDMPMLGANRYFYQSSPGILLYLVLILNIIIKSRNLKISFATIFIVLHVILFRLHITSWKNQITLFEENAKYYPNEEFLYRLAIEYQKLGNTKNALICLEKGDQLGTNIWINNVWMYYKQRSELYLKAKKYNKALADINTAIKKTEFKTPYYDSILLDDRNKIEAFIKKNNKGN